MVGSMNKSATFTEIYKSLLRESVNGDIQECKKLIYSAINLKGKVNGEKSKFANFIIKKISGIKYDVEKDLFNFSFVYACRHGLDVILELLLNMGIDVNTYCNVFKTTGLIIACKYGKMDVVKLLIKNNVNIYGKDVDDQINAILHACICGHNEIVEMMINKFKHDLMNNIVNKDKIHLILCKSFIISCKHGYIDIVKLLVKENININACFCKNNKIVSGFIYACKYGRKDIVKYLINKRIENYHMSMGFYYCFLNSKIRLYCDEYLDIFKIFISFGYNFDKCYMEDKGFKNIYESYINTDEYVKIKNDIYQSYGSDIYLLMNLVDTGYLRLIEM